MTTAANAANAATTTTEVHGVLGEFSDGEILVAAARRARAQGWTRMEACTPAHVEGLREALGLPRTRLPLLVLLAGVAGCASGLALQDWISSAAYPLNVGGRPEASWPSFVPVAFEATVLFASLAAVLGMLARSGLPRLHHPLFNAERFAPASRDRYFLCLESADPSFDVARARALLAEAGATNVVEVAP